MRYLFRTKYFYDPEMCRFENKNMVLKMCSKTIFVKSSGLILHLQTTVIFLHRYALGYNLFFHSTIVLFFCMNYTYFVLEMVIMVVHSTDPWHLLGWNNPNFLISHICFFSPLPIFHTVSFPYFFRLIL